jgi:hypothetical protein
MIDPEAGAWGIVSSLLTFRHSTRISFDAA